MKIKRLKNWIINGIVALASMIFGLLLLFNFSYRALRLFYMVAEPVSLPLLVGSLISVPIALIWSNFVRRRIRVKCILLWSFVFSVALINCWINFFSSVELTAEARFQQTQYYLIRIEHIDGYGYSLYRCDRTGLLCLRSPKISGVPYHPDSIILKYDDALNRVYIQNRDERIEIPD